MYKWGAPFPILYDTDKGVISNYGVLDGNTAKPATFIIDKNGVIRWKYVGNAKTDRPDPETVLKRLQALEG